MKSALSGVVSSLFLCAMAAHAESACATVTDQDKVRLVDYVQKKYNAPKTVTLTLTELSFVNSTCYRTLRFKSDNPRSSFKLDLILSPDLRFLTRDLLDSTVDPIAEAREKQQALEAGLVHGNPPSLGPEKAPSTLVVFSDFQCPFCSRAAELIKEVLATDQDKVRLVYRFFPLSMHPWARAGAEAAACAADQGNANFWILHDYMFEHQKELKPENLTAKAIAQLKDSPNFDASKFLTCMAEGKASARIEEDIAFGNDHGVHGTPTAFLNGKEIQLIAPEQLRTLLRQIASDPSATVPEPDKKTSRTRQNP